eukprot:PITA_02290
MEPLWKLTYLLEPASLALIVTAVLVVFASAQRALNYEKEMERNRDFSESSITLDSSQALMIPIASSCSLLLMFYLFASMSHLVTAFTAVASASSLAFCLSPYVFYINSKLGSVDPMVTRCCCRPFTRMQGILVLVSSALVIAWLVSGHWILNNLLGISICIAFVSHVRLPNIKICSLLLASNPVHTVANTLNLPGLQSITKKLELPVKLVFPRNLLGGMVPGNTAIEFMMLGLGDMAIPGMLLALVLCFDHRKSRDTGNVIDVPFVKGRKYIWYALSGYAAGLIAALAAGVLTQSPQPALLYLAFISNGHTLYFSLLIILSTPTGDVQVLPIWVAEIENEALTKA